MSVEAPSARTIRVRASGRWTTPADVVAGLRTRWERGDFLDGGAPEAAWLPVVVPLRSPSVAEISADYAATRDWVSGWRARAGRLRVEWAAVGGRLIGVNDLPKRVWADSPQALWSLLGVARQVERYAEITRSVHDTLPELAPWVADNAMKAIAHEAIWDRLRATAEWFRDVARPGTHLRQIDVPGVDTKFIENHRSLLAELLDACLPPERIAAQYPRSDFVRRYGGATKPTYLRLRRLDGTSLYPGLAGVRELSLRSDELACVPVPCSTVFVVENEVSYLAFPPLPQAVAVFGGGYAVSLLTAVSWLAERDLVYWGDIDTHGFVMLDRLRAAFPAVTSVLMDRDTLLDHETHWGHEPTQVNTPLAHLTADEARLYEDLLEATFGPALRLEQERVGFRALIDAVKPWTPSA